MNQHAVVPAKLSAVLDACRAAAFMADDLEAAPAQVARLREELDGVNSQINLVRQSLASERAVFDAWRRQATDESDLSATSRDLEQRDLAAVLADRRAVLVRVQNQIAAEGRELERIVREIRRLERQWANPVAAPSQ
jgi:chromosome segregation ATPase